MIKNEILLSVEHNMLLISLERIKQDLKKYIDILNHEYRNLETKIEIE